MYKLPRTHCTGALSLMDYSLNCFCPGNIISHVSRVIFVLDFEKTARYKCLDFLGNIVEINLLGCVNNGTTFQKISRRNTTNTRMWLAWQILWNRKEIEWWLTFQCREMCRFLCLLLFMSNIYRGGYTTFHISITVILLTAYFPPHYRFKPRDLSQLQFMYVLMEEFTNLCNYPTPKDTRLVKNIIAENDGYVIRAGVPTMQQVWPGTTVEVSGKLHWPPALLDSGLFFLLETTATIASLLSNNHFNLQWLLAFPKTSAIWIYWQSFFFVHKII